MKKIVISLIVILVVVAIGWQLKNLNQSAWTEYRENIYGFDIKYPQEGWKIQDSISENGCCLFVVKQDLSTTTSTNASGTPLTTVTATQPIKIQIGYYYKTKTFDPFKAGSTTAITLGKNTVYSGKDNSGTPFYLFPLTSQDGIGAAYFTALENTDVKGNKKIVEDILSTISFFSTTTAALMGTSTATTNK